MHLQRHAFRRQRRARNRPPCVRVAHVCEAHVAAPHAQANKRHSPVHMATMELHPLRGLMCQFTLYTRALRCSCAAMGCGDGR
jgi:hypothetical protein